MNALKKIKHDPIAMVCVAVISLVVLAGILAPVIAPNDPEQVNMSLKYAGISKEYPLGNDYLGRCTLSRLMSGNIEHYIFQNNNNITAAWYVDSLECSISTTLSVTELKKMIDSIYEE